jgi:hyperosmotically inducible periplasmic protein
MSLAWETRRLTTALLLSAAATRTLAGLPSPMVPSYIANNQATRVIGKTIENTDGEKLGKIKDLVIAGPSGEVKYVLVSSGGILGVASHTKVVPAPAVSLATSKAGIAWLEIGSGRWKSAPQFKRKSLSELTDARKAAQLEQYYFAGNARPTQKAMPATGPGASGRSGASPATLYLASELIGRGVQGPGRESIGALADLLMDLQGGKPTFAIIWAHRQIRKDYTFAVPYQSLGFDGIRFTTSASAATLERARNFNAKIWAAPEPNAIYRYQMVNADNTARNARDRDGRSLTPLDQSEAESDVQITRRVRQQLTTDDKLTFTAKNVKIITINGRVTLRGPVKHQFEKEIIQRKAELIAGNGKVENLLEVEQGDSQ